MSGTELGYAATSPVHSTSLRTKKGSFTCPIALRACYAMSGTETAYAATSRLKMRLVIGAFPPPAFPARCMRCAVSRCSMLRPGSTRCLVLRKRMVLRGTARCVWY
eukprot:3285569-Rhodomonas_salina.1